MSTVDLSKIDKIEGRYKLADIAWAISTDLRVCPLDILEFIEELKDIAPLPRSHNG